MSRLRIIEVINFGKIILGEAKNFSRRSAASLEPPLVPPLVDPVGTLQRRTVITGEAATTLLHYTK